VRSRRRALGALVVVAWLVLLGAHARREYFQPELARLALASMTLSPGTSFYTLRMGERAVGQASSRLDTVPGGFALEDQMVLELPALGQTGTAVARTTVELDRSLLMRRFAFSLDSEAGRFEARGEVVGDSALSVTIVSQGSSQTVTHRLASPPVFSAIVPIRVAVGGELRVGNTVRLPVFDPATLSTRSVEVRVLGQDTLVVADSSAYEPATGRWTASRFDSIPVWRIAEVFGGISVESWVDADGRVIRASSPLGFSMEKTEFELARQALGDDRGRSVRADEDVIFSTAIRSNVDLGAVEQHAELRFRLAGVDLAGFELEGGRQTMRGDTLIVRRETWSAIDPSYTLPYKRMDLREALEPEPLVQSDDPRIVDAAERMSGRRPFQAQNPRTVAERLTESLYRRVAKEVTISVPSALQVLETMRGDCNEHTVLFVALARALGLPARTAVGLVYLDGAFYYHAWPEVWLDEWVAVDPTFGQAPASAAHLRFMTGGLAQQVEIARLIGRLEIEVLL
jgi:hypothetical protein